MTLVDFKGILFVRNDFCDDITVIQFSIMSY